MVSFGTSIVTASSTLAIELQFILDYYNTYLVPYPRERGPMGGAPYTGPRLGGGLILEVSVLHLYAKERPGKLPTLSS